jgi:hypothetical protein
MATRRSISARSYGKKKAAIAKKVAKMSRSFKRDFNRLTCDLRGL